jgi:hypothetical protein
MIWASGSHSGPDTSIQAKKKAQKSHATVPLIKGSYEYYTVPITGLFRGTIYNVPIDIVSVGSWDYGYCITGFLLETWTQYLPGSWYWWVHRNLGSSRHHTYSKYSLHITNNMLYNMDTSGIKIS